MATSTAAIRSRCCSACPGLGDTGPMSPDQFLTEYWNEELARTAREGALIAAVALPAEIEAWAPCRFRRFARGHRLRDGHAATCATATPSTPTACSSSAAGRRRPRLSTSAASTRTSSPAWSARPGTPARPAGPTTATCRRCSRAAEPRPPPLRGRGGVQELHAPASGDLRRDLGLDARAPARLESHQGHARAGRADPNKAYWVEVPPIDAAGDISITAEVNRADNTVTVTSQGLNR